MVPFWVPTIIRGLIRGPNLGDPKRDQNFDNPPYIQTLQRTTAVYGRVQLCIGGYRDVKIPDAMTGLRRSFPKQSP